MAVIQLTELIPVTTPLGNGWAILVETTQHDQFWTVALDSRAIVTFPQSKILLSNSYTLGRGLTDEKMRQIIGKATANN